RRGHVLRLPFLAWLSSLPLGIPAMMTAGGTINSFQGFVLLLPPVLVLLGTAALRRRSWFPAAAALSLALIGTRWAAQPNRPLLPATTALIQADQISRLYPAKIWFPWNPTVTYFSDGRFYHAEDGIYVRMLTGHRLSWRQLEQGLPSDIQYVALFGQNWGIAKSFAHGSSFEQQLGYWELWRWKER
ncbi:MAG TPA: hypothetical protein VEA63_09725, partial [Opitutus sp.]|nr:hypothetical protein [Opitutus sp.]